MCSESSSVARSVNRRDALSVFRLTCDVPPDSGAIGNVESDIGSVKNRGNLSSGCLVRVEVNRDSDFFSQCLDKLRRGSRFAQSGHVLDG
jgi:hypothetical protein